MKKYIKIVKITLVFMILSTFCSAQIMYFRLNKDEAKPSISNKIASFHQPEIQNKISGLIVKPVLENPEKFHSKSARLLKRTYKIDLSSVSISNQNLLLHGLIDCGRCDYVEIEEDDITVGDPCPTNDPKDAPWNLTRHDMMCVQEAFCITQGDESIKIGIMDEGVRTDHPDLVNKIDYIHPNSYTTPGHGTHVAGAAACDTDNGYGLSSSGFNCRLMLFPPGHYTYEDAILQGVRVFNHSTGLCNYDDNNTYQTKINMATEEGVIIVGAAANGNYGPSCGADDHGYFYPASFENVISVSGCGSQKNLESTWDCDGLSDPFYSTHNDMVDFICQGLGLDLLGNVSDFLCGKGTSFAAPQVAGVIGLMLSVNPCLNHDDVMDILNQTGSDISDVSNNSSFYDNGQVPLVPCAESAVIMAQDYTGSDLVISENTDWGQKYVSGRVIINDGATLTIYGIASMGKNSKIIVKKGGKLVVDGGLITSCGEEWKGIVVEGDAASGNQNNAGYVELKNGAILENARDLISMDPKHISWPDRPDYWGGLVVAENSTFRNCKRAVAFMKYGTGFIKDQSKFTNCTFEDIEYSGVSLWADNGVTFDGCTFNNIGNIGIGGHDTEFIVENGCQFTNQHTGVDVLTTYPIFYAPKIGNDLTLANDFQCSNYGVFMQSQGNIKTLEVKNNNFLGSLYGVHINGFSNFIINGNDFSGGYAGIDPVSTGFTHSNYVTFNNISSSAYGSQATYNNSNLEYLDNCFGYSSLSDIYVNNGAIWLSQGTSDVANGNCFSKGGVPEIDNTGNDEIELHVWEDEPPTSCEYPTVVNDDPSYKVKVEFDSPTFNNDNCGSSFSPGIINVRTFCKGPFKTKQRVLNKIAEIEALIEEVNNNPNLSQSYKNYLLRIYKRCLSSLQVETVIIIMEPSLEDPDGLPESERIEAAIDYISQVEDFNLQILAYGLMVNTDQLDRARLFLNSLTRSNMEQNNFVLAQNINLDYLSDTHNYVLSSNDESLLYSIGVGIEPLDGYARSIYEVLKGERIELSIPDPHNSTRPRIAVDGNVSTNVEFSIYPNPVSEDYVIIESNSSSDNKTICEIFDINGKMILNQTLDQSLQSINTSNWYNGMYFVVIKDNSGTNIHTSKLFLAH